MRNQRRIRLRHSLALAHAVVSLWLSGCRREPTFTEAVEMIPGYDNAPAFSEFLQRHPEMAFARDDDGLALIHVAATRMDRSYVEALIEIGVNPNLPALQERVTPLMFAAERGNSEVVRALLDAGAAVNCLTTTGYCVLNRAIWHAHDTRVLAMLLEAGADPNCVTHPCSSHLYTAVLLYKSCDAARLLLEAGAFTDVRAGPDREYPLHLAAKRPDPEMTQLLLEYEADPNVTDDFGHTPLHIAAGFGRLDTVRLLLEHGADPQLRCTHGLTAAGYVEAKFESAEELRRLLTPSPAEGEN